MTNPALMTWSTLLRRLRPRPVAIIREYSNTGVWFIETRGVVPGRDKPRNDWDTCPGTLYQDFDTPQDAIAAARWWGYTVIR